MKIEVVFQETDVNKGIKKNDIYTYEKLGYFIDTYINSVQIISDFNEDYTNEKWFMELINGLNDIGVKYEVLKIEL